MVLPTVAVVIIVLLLLGAFIWGGLSLKRHGDRQVIEARAEADARARREQAGANARARARDKAAREKAEADMVEPEDWDESLNDLFAEYQMADAWAKARFVQIFKERRKTGSEALAWYAVLLEVDAKLENMKKGSVEADAWANLRDDIDASLKKLLNEDPAKIKARFDAQIKIDDDEVLRKAYEVYRTWKETSGGESDAAGDRYRKYCDKNGVTAADKRLIETRYRNEYQGASA